MSSSRSFARLDSLPARGYLLAPPYPLVNPEPIDLDLLAVDPFGRIHAA